MYTPEITLTGPDTATGVWTILLALLGGIVGVGAGVIATVICALHKGWTISIPVAAWAGRLRGRLGDRRHGRPSPGAACSAALPDRGPPDRLASW